MYGVACARIHHDWPRRMRAYPLLAALAVGLSLNGTVAVLRALSGRGGAFERTPKLGEARAVAGAETEEPAGGRAERERRAYHLPVDAVALGESALAAYAWLMVVLAAGRGAIGLLPLLLIFALGYSVTAAQGLVMARSPGRRPCSTTFRP
jgi:hypothetical protein